MNSFMKITWTPYYRFVSPLRKITPHWKSRDQILVDI